jgi:hypothetical protein
MKSRLHPRFAPSSFAAACLVAIAAASGCSQDVPAASSFASADAAQGDTGALDGSVADAATASDSSAAPDNAVAADTQGDAPSGPSCQQALDCLVAAKQWQPGKPPPQLASCTKDISAAESAEMDGLLGCIDQHCAKELDTWDKGGVAELQALHVCMIGKCPTHVTACMGGHGADNCATALKCMLSCMPTDESCNSKCLQPTSDEASKKAGNFLTCVFANGCSPDKMATCTIPLSCGLKCPELAGG